VGYYYANSPWIGTLLHRIAITIGWQLYLSIPFGEIDQTALIAVLPTRARAPLEERP
jgi:hypothetical protein